MLFSFQSLSMVGLHVTQEGLSLVHLKRIKQGFHLLGVSFIPLPDVIFAEGKIKDWEKLTSFLKEEVEILGLSGLPAVICLPSNLVRMQHIKLPVGLDEHEIEEEIIANINQDLPGLSETLALDFTIQQAEDIAYSNVFFVAAREEYLAHYVRAVNQACLKTKIIEVDIFALTRMVMAVSPWVYQENDLRIIAYFINTTASFIACRKGEIVFHQHWMLVETFTFAEQLKNKLELCWPELSRAKRRQLILCTIQLDPQVDALFSDWEIHYADPFKLIQFGENIDAVWVTKNKHHLLFATGAAMREVPKW